MGLFFGVIFFAGAAVAIIYGLLDVVWVEVLKRPLIREDLNVIQSTSLRRLMPHLLHQMVQNITNLGGHSIQIMIITNQVTT